MFANKFIKILGLLLGLWSLNGQGSAIYYNAINLTKDIFNLILSGAARAPGRQDYAF